MKRGSNVFMCLQYESIKANSGRTGGWADSAVYTIKGEPGLWRRVRDPNLPDPTERGIVPSLFDAQVIYLKYDVVMNSEFAEGGFLLPSPEDTSEAIEKAIEYARQDYKKTQERIAAGRAPKTCNLCGEDNAEVGDNHKKCMDEEQARVDAVPGKIITPIESHEIASKEPVNLHHEVAKNMSNAIDKMVLDGSAVEPLGVLDKGEAPKADSKV